MLIEPKMEAVDSGGDRDGLANNDFLATAQPKKRNVFVRLTNGDTHLFLIKPDVKEEKMYCCLAISKPFATSKCKGVMEAWIAAVADINTQPYMTTGGRLFDPLISVKAVRGCIELVMKIIRDL
jgi:hypothetical protein